MLRIKIETMKQQETAMPLVQVHTIKGVFTPQMKKKVIEKVTDAMVGVEGENLRGVTWVTINEIDSGDWGIGGQTLTSENGKALAAGKTAPRNRLNLKSVCHWQRQAGGSAFHNRSWRTSVIRELKIMSTLSLPSAKQVKVFEPTSTALKSLVAI